MFHCVSNDISRALISAIFRRFIALKMFYQSDFAYFLRDPVPNSDAIKRPYISIGQNKNNNILLPNVTASKNEINDDKIRVVNVNDYSHLKRMEKGKIVKNAFVTSLAVNNGKGKDNETAAVKRVAVKWAAKTSVKNSLIKLFKRYCENTTVHGIKYFAQKEQHWSER